MQRARLAVVGPGTDLYLVFSFPFRDGDPLHRGVFIFKFKTRLEKWYREHQMVGTSISVYCCEESLPNQRIWAMYPPCPAGANRGSNNRSVAHPSEYLLGGVPAIGTCPGRHWAVHFWPTAHQSPYYHLFLGPNPGTGQAIGGR